MLNKEELRDKYLTMYVHMYSKSTKDEILHESVEKHVNYILKGLKKEVE